MRNTTLAAGGASRAKSHNVCKEMEHKIFSTVTAKGQVTLLFKARRKLGIRAGAKLDFVIKDNDRLEVIVISGSIKNLKGMLPKPKRTLTLVEMDRAIRERTVSKSGK